VMSAMILAAGNSSRMGRAKQLLPLGHSTVLLQTIENVCAAGFDEILVVLGASAAAIQQGMPPALLESVNIVVNPAYEQGIATSLQAGLTALNPASHAVLVALGDQPFVRPATMCQIIERYRAERAKIAIPTYRGQRGNPVLLDRAVFPEAMNLQGDVGFRALFNKHLQEIVSVEVDDPAILVDLDSPADYERLRN
jgi:molybdenum cofactor cytidylyltransferase